MIGSLLQLGLWLLGLFGFGKPDPIKQGEELQRGKDAEAILAEVEAQRAAAGAPIPPGVRKLTYRD